MKNLELLSQISLLSVRIDNFSEQINNILSLIGKYSNVSRTYIFINNENNTRTTNEYEWCNDGIKPEIQDFQNRELAEIPSLLKILQENGKLFSTNIENLPNDLYKVFISQNIKSLLVYPLYIDKKMIGFVGYDECKRNRNWTNEEINILATISGIISNLYRNHYYLKKIKNDKQYFEDFFNTIPEFILIADLKGKINYINKYTKKHLKYFKDELLNINITDIYEKNDKNKLFSKVNKVLNGEIKSLQLNIITKDNIKIPVETRIWYGKWNNKDCIFVISKDISAEQEALQKFSKIFRNNPALMALCNIDDKKFIDVNTSFINKLGYTYSQIIGKTSSELKLFPNLLEHQKTTKELSQKGIIKNIEQKVRCKDGSILHGLFSGEIIESQGKKFFLTVMIDVTEKKLMEQKFIELSRRDSLTNIFNRRYMFKLLENNLEKYKKEKHNFSITIIDIDFFKEINDNYGHVTGDYTLIELTKLISNNLTKNQVLGRYGGEEFIIISINELKDYTAKKINSILNLINKTKFIIKNTEIKLSFSAGISDTQHHDINNITVEKLINISDKRLYIAKKTGRNKVIYTDI